MERNHPLPHRGVTVINAVPLASGVAEVCYQVAGIESFGVLAYYCGERICTLFTRWTPNPLRRKRRYHPSDVVQPLTLLRWTAGKALNATPRRYVEPATRRPAETFRLPFDTRGIAAERQSLTTQARGTST